MMKKMARDGSGIGEDSSIKDKEVCSNLPEDSNSWPFRIDLQLIIFVGIASRFHLQRSLKNIF